MMTPDGSGLLGGENNVGKRLKGFHRRLYTAINTRSDRYRNNNIKKSSGH